MPDLKIGMAMQEIKKGDSVISAQLAAGFESGSGFRDAFSKFLEDVPARINKDIKMLKARWLDTALGPMLAIADEEYLYLLEFVSRRGLEREILRLRKRGFAIMPGDSVPLKLIAAELKLYFSGRLKEFKTPYQVFGSPFQQQVWQELVKIPYGETGSYKEQAVAIGKPNSYRAVANANGANQLALIIPCHRIIASDGSMGGYGGGVAVKEWLLKHEKAMLNPLDHITL
jgi:AraC family transcriptional regulator, regulatory protein of adaptative response / methylated-DNA-[protein]-cysteine methyltransferase